MLLDFSDQTRTGVSIYFFLKKILLKINVKQEPVDLTSKKVQGFCEFFFNLKLDESCIFK